MSTLLNNRYRTLKVLGSGMSGKTYLAEDTHIPSNRRCVIKQLRPPTDTVTFKIIKERFQREAVILERLCKATDKIPTLQAYFSEGQDFYLVQDWIEGKSLAQRVQENGPFTAEQVKSFLTRVLPVLDYVHSQGIVHRDIKPENIMLRDRDDQPILIDFGAVKEVVAEASSTIIIGSPGYMPPEQANGQPVFASDIYSLGLTAAYLLTGKRPQELSVLNISEQLAKESKDEAALPIITVIEKASRLHPQERYQAAREMLEAIEEIDVPTVLSDVDGTDSTPPSTFKTFGARTVLLLGGLLLLTAGIVFATITIFLKRRPQLPPATETKSAQTSATAEFEVTRTHDLFTTVRSAPRTSSPELGRVYPDSKIICQTTTVKGETLWDNNEWRYCPSVGGYIHSTLVRPSQP